MGSLLIECPLCCCKSFDSKESLLEHLVYAADKLNCPLCNTKCDSLSSIIAHLSQSNCHIVQENSVGNIVFYEHSSNDAGNSASGDAKNINRITDELNAEFITDQTYECQDETGDVNKMYELILKPHDLKLLKEDGESRYVIVNHEVGGSSDMSTIVTKQNSDGTVSLTSSQDVKEETDTLIVLDPEMSDTHGEIYTCNACKVSFTSVYEHIQNYHNDQEVVLQDIAPEESENSSVPLDSHCQEDNEGSICEKQPARRVITDTGDIVEEPVIIKTEKDELSKAKTNKKSKVVLDKQGRNRRLVQIKKTNKTTAGKSVVKKTTKDGTGTINPYHKVVSKEVQTENGVTVSMYHCLLCNINVNTPNEFENYTCTINGSTEPEVNFECGVCSTVFLTNKSLKLHKRMHDPVKSRPIEPPVENNDGTNLTGSVYRCNICDKVIPYDYRKIHENSHKVGDKMNCSICNKKFTSMEYLEMHMNVHTVDKVAVNKTDKSLPYECVYCNRRFARPHEKVKHERIHTGEKPHECEICGKSFRVSYCLTLHMRTHTGARPYACQHCGKRFKAHSVYNHHLLTHSEVRAYKCPFCPKAFKTSVQLAGHKNSHTKPFSCQQCNRPFASLYAVRLHTETHARQNNLKFSCTLCGASYAREFALKDHVRQVHSEKQEPEGETEEVNNYVTDWSV